MKKTKLFILTLILLLLGILCSCEPQILHKNPDNYLGKTFKPIDENPFLYIEFQIRDKPGRSDDNYDKGILIFEDVKVISLLDTVGGTIGFYAKEYYTLDGEKISGKKICLAGHHTYVSTFTKKITIKLEKKYIYSFFLKPVPEGLVNEEINITLALQE